MTAIADPTLAKRQRTSVATLVIANLAPLAGVLFFDWSVFLVLLTYWLENVILGGINVFKMALCRGPIAPLLMKFVLIPFFIVHYGMFTYGHGAFVMHFFADEGASGERLETIASMVELIQAEQLTIAVLALAGSHVVSFFVNYLFGGEYRKINLGELMFAPYGRIVVLHVTILIGGLLVQALGAPIWALLLLVSLKIGIDLAAHAKSHRKLAAAAQEIDGTAVG